MRHSPLPYVIEINSDKPIDCRPTEDIVAWDCDDNPYVLYSVASQSAFEHPPLEFRPLSILIFIGRSLRLGTLFLWGLFCCVLSFPFAVLFAFITRGFYPRETLNVLRIGWSFVQEAGKGCRGLIDFRRPLLFLRAHADDGFIVEASFDTNPLKLRTPGEWERDDVIHSSRPLEEGVADLFAPYGPLVALRPGKNKQVSTGFRRYDVSFEEWQRQILHWMRASQFIVIMIGPPATMVDPKWGLAWEIATAIKMNAYHKVVLVMPPVGKKIEMRRWAAYEKLLKQLAPEAIIGDIQANYAIYPTGSIFSPLLYGRISVVDQDWRHHFVKCGTSISDYQESLKTIVRDVRPWRGRFLRFLNALIAGLAASLGAVAVGSTLFLLAWGIWESGWIPDQWIQWLSPTETAIK